MKNQETSKFQIYFKLCIFLVIINLSYQAFCQDRRVHIIFSGFYYASSNKNYELSSTDNITNTINQHTYTALGIWYEFKKFCLGIKNIENTSKQNIKINTNDQTTNRTITTHWFGLGPSIGYFITNALFLHANWFLQNDKTIITEVENSKSYKIVYYGGYAWSVDMGYEFDVDHKIKIGPQISFIHFDFKKIKNSSNISQNLNTTQIDNQFMPHILIGIAF